jgi:hypothetical protein
MPVDVSRLVKLMRRKKKSRRSVVIVVARGILVFCSAVTQTSHDCLANNLMPIAKPTAARQLRATSDLSLKACAIERIRFSTAFGQILVNYHRRESELPCQPHVVGFPTHPQPDSYGDRGKYLCPGRATSSTPSTGDPDDIREDPKGDPAKRPKGERRTARKGRGARG